MEYKIIMSEAFAPEPIGFYKPNKKGLSIGEDFIALDTETSHNHNKDNPICWLYQWAFVYNKAVIMGRKPTELVQCLRLIQEVNSLEYGGKSLVIYVHNLAYDYTYIKDWIRQEFGGKETLIAVSKRQVLSWEIGGFIFKCSYKLSLKSLDKWAKELNTEHKKLTGTVDYDIIRYQNTPLTDIDDKYMIGDVVTLYECIEKQMKLYNDNLKTIPLTVTGYVRRKCRNNFKRDRKNRQEFMKNKLNLHTYDLCHREFAGGITHGNRFKVDETIEGVIKHRDFASHYPSQQICAYAPVSKFVKVFDWKTDGKMKKDTLLKYCSGSCVLCELAVNRMKIKEGITLPYAQYSKFKERKSPGTTFIQDNGRILAMEGMSIISVNELDLNWLLKQYNIKCKVLRLYVAKRGKFPEFLTDTVNEFFYGKTKYKKDCQELLKKGYSEVSDTYLDMYRTLMINKGELNGIYGMSATNPVRVEYIELPNGEWEENKPNEEETEQKLNKYYAWDSWNNFMSYQLGVWTTAQARNELMEFVELIGYDNFLYADTDSIFYLSTPEIEARVEAKNKEYRDIDDKNNYYIEYQGKRVYYNQFELEDEEIKQFRFLHSKCYAYVTTDNQLHSTIAGVTKKGRNGNNRVKELGSIENLTLGFVFKDCGGTSISYVNNVPDTIDIDGHLTEVASGGIISNVEKTLNNAFIQSEENFDWEVYNE